MHVEDLPIGLLREAAWNPNRMDEDMLARLRESLGRFGLVEPLVVRPSGSDAYEVLSGNQRLQVLRQMGVEVVPCVVVEQDDARARLLAQALNHLRGEDDLGLRGELLREVLAQVPQQEVLALLPETLGSLQALVSLGRQELAAYLQAWQQAQGARLKHFAFQLTQAQAKVVEEALNRVLPQAREARGDSPNVRGTALYLLCQAFLEREGTL